MGSDQNISELLMWLAFHCDAWIEVFQVSKLAVFIHMYTISTSTIIDAVRFSVVLNVLERYAFHVYFRFAAWQKHHYQWDIKMLPLFFSAPSYHSLNYNRSCDF